MSAESASDDKDPAKPDPLVDSVPKTLPAPAKELNTAEVDEWGLPVKKHPHAPDETDNTPQTVNNDKTEPQAKVDDRKEKSEDAPPPPTPAEVPPSTTQPHTEPKPEKRASGTHAASAWSHQQLAPETHVDQLEEEKEEEWQAMPAFAPFDIYNDDGKLIAKEAEVEKEDFGDFANLGGAAKGYTRVQMDEDAQSATSLDDNTAYLFKEQTTNILDEEEEGRDMQSQMQTTKTLLTEGQRIAYVGIVRLAIIEMMKQLSSWQKTRGSKKALELAIENTAMWSQMIMLRLYGHMEIESAGEYFFRLSLDQLSD
jgi:hypothetical protein